MSTKKPQRKQFLHLFLVLCCFTFCLSACISGETTCENCESGSITIIVDDCKLQPIIEKTLDNCGPYSFQVPPAYLGQQVNVFVHCDKDNSGDYTIGDYFGVCPWFELELNNENINIDVNMELTHFISGKVICDVYDSEKDEYGKVKVAAWNKPPWEDPSAAVVGSSVYFDLNENGEASYRISLWNATTLDEVWVSGIWDRDWNGLCQGPKEGDWVGNYPEAIPLNDEEITGIDFNCCLVEITESSE